MKSKYIIILALTAMLSVYAKAEPVDTSTARTVASHFFASKFKRASEQFTATIVYEAAALHGDNGEWPSFYAVNINSEGFVIVAGDDLVPPILAFSDEGGFMAEGMPANLRFFLDGYTEEIQYAVVSKQNSDEATLRQWQNLLSGVASDRKDGNVVVEPLLGNNEWNQTKYYNDLCPADASGNSAYGGHAAVGCGALVMGQVMRYWRYPTTGTGSHSYNATGYGTLSANFGATTYRYSAMPDKLTVSNHPDSCVEAVATHCGVAVNMRYGTDASVANSNNIVSALPTYFGYPATVRYIERGNTSATVWLSYLKGELNEGAPFMYGGSGNYGGHVWTCDGYRDDNYFHFNWGWGGTQNGYYALTNCSTYGFNSNHAIIIGIRGPELPTDPEEPEQPEVAIDEPSTVISKLFPNPTTGNVLVCSEANPIQEVQVFDMYGRLLSCQSAGQTQFAIDLSSFASGTYMLKFVTGKGVETRKVLKK